MAQVLVDDEMWALIEPLLPPPEPRRFRFPGRKPIDNRKALTGIIFVLKSGIPWEMLPQEMGCGSGMTCWRRLRDWQESGTWKKIFRVLLDHLNKADEIDWSRTVVDSGSVRAVGGGKKNRAESNRPKETGKQTSYYNGREWNTLGDNTYRRSST